jgi:hypothetical protein
MDSIKRVTLHDAIDYCAKIKTDRDFSKMRKRQNSMSMKGNLNSRDVKSLKDILLRKFKTVETTGKGRKRVFICSKPQNEIQEQKNNYANCGHSKSVTREYVTKKLLSILMTRKTGFLTHRQWIEHLDSGFNELSAHEKIIESKFFEFKEIEINGHNIHLNVGESYVYREYQRIRRHFRNAIGELIKNNIIDMQYTFICKGLDNGINPESGYYMLTDVNEIKEFNKKLTELRNKYNLQDGQEYWCYDENTQNFLKEESDWLHQQGFEYQFKVYSFDIICSNASIKKKMFKMGMTYDEVMDCIGKEIEKNAKKRTLDHGFGEKGIIHSPSDKDYGCRDKKYYQDETRLLNQHYFTHTDKHHFIKWDSK